MERRGAFWCGPDCNPVLIECEFYRNHAGSVGKGGAFNYASQCSPIVSSCVFLENIAWRGGAIYSHSSSAEIRKCAFIYNGSSGYGGAIYFCNSSGSVDSCEFYDQDSGGGGGTIAARQNSTPVFSFCNLINGFAFVRGGALWCENGSAVELHRCTVSENTADRGGVVYCLGANVLFENTILWGDGADHAGQEILFDSAGGTVTFVCSDADTALFEGPGSVN